MRRYLAAHGRPPSILLVMGVSGAGKTTVGRRLAHRLGWAFRDADEFHPPANVAKMSAGMPLTDDDRWPWLDAIGGWIDSQCAAGERAVVTCSALRRAYRDRLRDGRPEIKIVYLKGSKALIAHRLSRRNGHFMPTSLLDSQFATLEEPLRLEQVATYNVALPFSHIVNDIARYIIPPRAVPR